MAFKAVNNFGLDAELAAKMEAKYDKDLEERVQVWIENVTGVVFDKNFGEMLKDGIILCQLVNTLIPGKIKKVNESGGLFKMQENITAFIRACREVGVPEASLFPTESLAQMKDVGQVLVTINAFANVVQQNRDKLKVKYNGPFLGVDEKEKKARQQTLKKTFSRKDNNEGASSGGNTLKKKWVVKPGGSAGVSLLNQGSAGIMEETKYIDAREEIMRKNLDGKGSSNEVSQWNKGSAGVMEETKYVDAREDIKRNKLDGKGADSEVSQWNKGSSNMERLKYVDPREDIKRGQL